MLKPVSVAAPGFYGLNKQQAATSLDENWATVADNCVIDDSGRISARKGWSQVTTSPLAGTPSVDQLFEYVNSSGVTELLSFTNSKIYSGTTSLTEKTGSLTISANNWKCQNFNNNVVGFQASHNPFIYTGTGNATELHTEIGDWTANTAYAVGDIVKYVASPDLTEYAHCTTSGTTHATTEPTWPAIGSTVADNTATRIISVGSAVWDEDESG